jgi:hypothetical protein
MRAVELKLPPSYVPPNVIVVTEPDVPTFEKYKVVLLPVPAGIESSPNGKVGEAGAEEPILAAVIFTLDAVEPPELDAVIVTNIVFANRLRDRVITSCGGVCCGAGRTLIEAVAVAPV